MTRDFDMLLEECWVRACAGSEARASGDEECDKQAQKKEELWPC